MQAHPGARKNGRMRALFEPKLAAGVAAIMASNQGRAIIRQMAALPPASSKFRALSSQRRAYVMAGPGDSKARMLRPAKTPAESWSSGRLVP